MRYETIEHLKGTDFKRLTGVERETFAQMLQVVETRLGNFGGLPKLSQADQLLMTLMYWREYRTEFHMAQSDGISEATVCRTLHKVEEALVRSKQFRLPGNTIFEVVLVDVSEQPVEHPKKPRNALQRQKEATYSESPTDCQPKDS